MTSRETATAPIEQLDCPVARTRLDRGVGDAAPVAEIVLCPGAGNLVLFPSAALEGKGVPGPPEYPQELRIIYPVLT